MTIIFDWSKQTHLPSEDIYFWLDYFEQYLAAMEGFLKNESLSIRERYRDIADPYNELEALEDFFPTILRQSFFVATYSLAEGKLDEMCRSVQKSKSLQRSLSDMSGKGIQRARKYLKKEAGITFPDSLKPIWEELNNYRKLRNCFVHNQGYLTSNDDGKYLREHYLPSHQQFLRLEDDEISLREGLCEEVIKTIRTFFEELNKI